MHPKDKSASNSFYETNLSAFGINDARSLGWQSADSQKLRFDIMTMIGNIDNCSILDVGCGVGDFYGYFKNNGYNVDYHGIDISDKVIQGAKEKFHDGNFETKDILKDDLKRKFDFVFAIGPFSIKLEDSMGHLKQMTAKMFDLSEKGVGFNCLSSYEDRNRRYSVFHYFEPEEVFRFCKTLTPMVTLKHDYLPFDFSVYMYK